MAGAAFKVLNMPGTNQMSRRQAVLFMMSQEQDNPELIGRAVQIVDASFNAFEMRWTFVLDIYTDPISPRILPKLVGQITVYVQRQKGLRGARPK